MKNILFVLLTVFIVNLKFTSSFTLLNLPDYCQNSTNSVVCENLNFGSVSGVEVQNDQRGSYRSVILQNSNIQHIPNGLADLSSINVTSLTIVNCNLKVLNETDLIGFEGLNQLTINGNSIRELGDGVFVKQTRLQMLDLQRNKIESLDANTFDGLVSLVYLNLAYNHISSLPVGVFSSLTLLHEIVLDSNALRVIPSNLFNDNTALQAISVRSNGIDFDKNYDFLLYVKSVKSLDLSGNYMTRVDDRMFSKTRNLQNLNLVGMGLISISVDAFKRVNDLRKLNMTDNRLKKFSIDTFTKANELQYLGLAENNLETIDFSSWMEYTPRLNRIDLSNNNWKDCGQIADVIQSLRENGVKLSYTNCIRPEQVDQINSDTTNINIIIGLSVLTFILAILSTILGYALCRSKKRISIL